MRAARSARVTLLTSVYVRLLFLFAVPWCSLIGQIRYFLQRPNMVSDTSGHCWIHSQSLVNPRKIVVHKVNRDHRDVALYLLGESVR
jgi:hypothetical protein